MYCDNNSCQFFNSVGQQNAVHWDNINKKTTCNICGVVASIQPCPARKVTKFNGETNIQTVYHLGIHICMLKLPHSYHDPYQRKAVKINLKDGPQQILLGEVAQELQSRGYTAARHKERKLNYMKLLYLKGKIVREQCTEEHSFKAVALFKEEMDKGDKYLFYRINDGSFNNQPDYVFKSSKEMGNSC